MLDPQDPCDDFDGDGNVDACEINHEWYSWPAPACMFTVFPGTSIPGCSTDGWSDPDGNVVWTGFYGGKNVAGPRYFSVGGTVVPPTSVGARVLGQQVDDHFGNAVGSDGRWLYISAPDHDALQEDVPTMVADRAQSGVVYQLRTDVRVPGQPNLAQLWIEPTGDYPNIDAEIPGRSDYTMPVPHQYIIETIGSTRGNDSPITINYSFQSCPDTTLDYIVSVLINKAWALTDAIRFVDISPADRVGGYFPYPTDSAGYFVDRTPQIVGPHPDSKISFVRALGDVDGDGVRDFAVGSPDVRQTIVTSGGVGFNGPVVGSIFIVYGRGVGLEGDYLLENLAADPGDPTRLRGVLLQGTSSGEKLARVFDNAGDFDGDGYDDVIVGNATANSSTGEVIIILGSPNLASPVGGWTVNGIVTSGNAIRFAGETAGDLVGANVAGGGDVDGDGYADILIAAPGAMGGRGAVYLIYGSPDISGQIQLANVGTVNLPGAKFVGRHANDQLGGGTKTIDGTMPGSPTQSFAAFSRGVAALGDIDGDGRDDYAIGAMFADLPFATDGGEVYVIYGNGD